MKKLATLSICAIALALHSPAAPTFTVDASQSAGKVSPRLYGLMTEEINHAYDGGLYAELIRNRAFLDSATAPVNWELVDDSGAEATMALDPTNSFNDKLTMSLRLTVTKAAKNHAGSVANTGYWGIPVQPNTRYRATLLARSEAGFTGPVTVSIVSDDGRLVYASEQFKGLAADWKKFEVVLKTGKVTPTTKARFQIALDQPEPSGSGWFRFSRRLGMISRMVFART